MEGANGVGGGIGVGGGDGDENWVEGGIRDANVDGDGDRVGTRTWGGDERRDARWEQGRERGGGWRPEDELNMRTGTGAGPETRAVVKYGNGQEDGNGNGNWDGIGENGGMAKEHKNLPKSLRRDVGNGGDLGGKRTKRRQEGVGSVATDPDTLANNEKSGGKAQGT